MGATAEELLAAHREHPPLRLRDVGRPVHDDLEALLARLLAKDPAARPGSGDELAVIMRAVAPVADTAPMRELAEAADDPLPVVFGPRPEPEIQPRPKPAPAPAVDRELEQALLGIVPAQPEEKPPGIPKWAPWVPPRWLLPAGAGLVALAVLLAGWLLLRHKPATRSAPARTAALPTPVDDSAPTRDSAAAPPPAPSPASPATPEQAARSEQAALPEQADPAAPGRPPAPSPWARQFDRAQKAIWTGQAGSAEATLQEVLKAPRLSRRDKARASRMMGDAEQKRGNKAAAADWYRRALKLADDGGEQDRLRKSLATVK